MGDQLSKYNWKKMSSASNSSDDVWIKDKFAIVCGYYCTTFYLEEASKLDGYYRFLDTHDPDRRTITYKRSDLQEAINYVEFDIASRIEEIRDKKLIQLGIYVNDRV